MLEQTAHLFPMGKVGCRIVGHPFPPRGGRRQGDGVLSHGFGNHLLTIVKCLHLDHSTLVTAVHLHTTHVVE